MKKDSAVRKMLITGANGGMGRECARLAAEEGYDLILADLVFRDLEGFTQTLSQHGVSVSSHILDVTDPDSIAESALELQQAGGVDAIIHTVGVSPTMADWQRIIDIDLVGTVRFLEATRAHLNSGGCAVCLSSSSGYMCPPNPEVEQLLASPLTPDLFAQFKALNPNPLESPGLAYCYAKKALRHYVADQAQVWGRGGGRLVSISPGLIDTEMGQQEYEATKNFEDMKSKVALGRLGNPEEIASTALFLASPKASYITGCDFLVDGGLIASLGMLKAF